MKESTQVQVPVRSLPFNLAHLPPITQATSAAIGSVISNAIVYPIELLTTRIQTRRLKRRVNKSARPPLYRHSSLTSELSITSNVSANQIPKDYTSLQSAIFTIIHCEEPSKSWFIKFYNGILTDSIATLINSFIYFYIYTNLNKLNIKYKKQKNQSINPNKAEIHWIQSTFQEILIGSLAGIISKAFTCPLNNITIRFQTRRSTARDSMRRRSFASSKNINSIPNSNASTRGKNHNHIESSKFYSNLISKSNLSSSSSSSSSSDDDELQIRRSRTISYISSLIATIKSIYRDRGWGGFWSGFGKNCILSLNPSLTLYLSKIINIMIRKVMSRLSSLKSIDQINPINDNSLIITFLNSALGSSLSTILTYPLMLSKTLIQSNVHPKRRQTSLSDRYRFYGSKALYTGLSVKLIKVFLAQGITMSIKNWIETRFILIWIALNCHHKLSKPLS